MNIKILIRLLGIFLFVYICMKVNITESLKILKTINPIFFFISFILGCFTIGIRVIRWRNILNYFKVRIPFFSCYKFTLIGNSYGSLTPGRLGELIKPYLLKNKGFSFVASLKSTLIDRICDLVIIIIFGVSSIFYLSYMQIDIKVNSDMFIFAILLLTIFVIMIVYFSSRFLKGKLSWLFQKYLPPLYNVELGNFKIIDLLVSRKAALSITSIFAFFMTCLKYYLLAFALNIKLSFIFFCVAISMLMLSRLLPISFLNLGPRESVLLFMFNLKGISQEDAFSYSLLILADMLIFILIGQVFLWIYFPKFKIQNK